MADVIRLVINQNEIDKEHFQITATAIAKRLLALVSSKGTGPYVGRRISRRVDDFKAESYINAMHYGFTAPFGR